MGKRKTVSARQARNGPGRRGVCLLGRFLNGHSVGRTGAPRPGTPRGRAWAGRRPSWSRSTRPGSPGLARRKARSARPAARARTQRCRAGRRAACPGACTRAERPRPEKTAPRQRPGPLVRASRRSTRPGPWRSRCRGPPRRPSRLPGPRGRKRRASACAKTSRAWKPAGRRPEPSLTHGGVPVSWVTFVF